MLNKTCLLAALVAHLPQEANLMSNNPEETEEMARDVVEGWRAFSAACVG